MGRGDSWPLVGFLSFGLTCFHLQPRSNSPDSPTPHPSTPPTPRSGFLVILRVGIECVSRGTGVTEGAANKVGWVLGAGRREPLTVSFPGPLLPALLWSSGGPSPGYLLLQVRVVGAAPTSQGPCLKGTKIPPVRGCWCALWPEPWLLWVLTGHPGFKG